MSQETCGCVAKIEAMLAEKNGTLVRAVCLDNEMNMSSKLVLATAKIDTKKRAKVPVVVVNFCPFCGKKNPLPQ